MLPFSQAHSWVTGRQNRDAGVQGNTRTITRTRVSWKGEVAAVAPIMGGGGRKGLLAV